MYVPFTTYVWISAQIQFHERIILVFLEFRCWCTRRAVRHLFLVYYINDAHDGEVKTKIIVVTMEAKSYHTVKQCDMFLHFQAIQDELLLVKLL
jgi:hypothetical protein